MRKFNIKNIAIAAAAMLMPMATTSCNYLDVVPPETADIDDTMLTKQQCISFLYGCYGTIAINHGVGAYGAHESSTDEYANPLLWGRLGQVTSWNQLSATKQSNLGIFQLPWNYSYDAIGMCNLFEKTLADAHPQGVVDSDRTRWIAEIKFLKAYYHFRLLENYGPIPIIDHYYGSDTSKEQIPGRSHFDYCVDRIVEWLDEAAKDLPTTVDLSDLGRATKSVCLALKSRVLLYAASPLWNGSFPHTGWKNTKYETPGYGNELVSLTYDREKWVRARDAAKEAIASATGEGNRSFYTIEASETQRLSEGVALPNIPGVDDDFKKKVMKIRYANNTVENEGNRELIWSVISNPDAWLFWPADHYPHNVITFSNGSTQGGNTALAPTLYTVEHFLTRNGYLPENDPEFRPSEYLKSAGIAGREDIINLCNNREPRFYANISFDGDEYSQMLWDGKPLVIDLKSSTAHGYNPDMYVMDNNTTGFLTKKWCQPNAAWHIDGNLNQRRIAVPMIKLAELYLNLAECEAALDNKSGAMDALNIVRRHGEIRELTNSDLSIMPIMEWVRNERFIELYCEAHRYYDVRRWMTAPQLLRNGAREGLNCIAKKDPTFEEFNRRTKIDQPFQWDTRMYLLPIPSSELYSDPQLVQAPGY